MIVEKIDEEEALEVKKIYNQYLDKRKKVLTSTQFKVEVIIGDVISKGSVSPGQIKKIK